MAAADGLPDWDVRQLVSHVVGTAAFSASQRETLRQVRAARRTGRPAPDSFNEVQVSERALRRPAELLAELRAIAQRSVHSPPTPAPAAAPGADARRRRALPRLADVGRPDPGRLDAPRRPGPGCRRTPEVTADHDGRIVADLVADWAGQHGRPYDLVLTGPAGGRFAAGRDAEPRELDAIEFARILAGRAPADGLPPPAVSSRQSVGVLGRPDHPEALEDDLLVLAELHAAGPADPLPVAAVAAQPVGPGPVALALVPGERVVDALHHPEPQPDRAQHDLRHAPAVADDPVAADPRQRLLARR